MPELHTKIALDISGLSRTIPHLCGMPRRLREKRRLMIFRTFVDESALNPQEDDALIMAGFIGEAGEWERASDAWNECLSQFPRIDYFKHKEANGLDGQFWKFDRTAADIKMRELARVIASFRIQGICAAVPYDSFANRDAKAAKGMFGSRAYDYGFFSLVFGVLRRMRDIPASGNVDFVFDKRPELKSCIENFNAMKDARDLDETLARDLSNAGNCFSGDDKEVSALQMADLLAGECSQTLKKRIRSTVFEIIADAKPVVHWTCPTPARTPAIFEAQKFSAELHASVLDLIRRAYGDKKTGPSITKDVEELRLEKEMFEQKVSDLLSSCQKGGLLQSPETVAFLKTVRNIRDQIYGKE